MIIANSRTPLRIAIGVVGAFAVGYVIAGTDGWGPPGSREQPIGQVSRWCERVSEGLMREPSNTLGNIGFIVAGLAMLSTLARDRPTNQNPFTGNTPISLLFAGAVVFLGPGSMVMHGTHTNFGSWIDNVSMVAFIIIPWLVNLSARGRWGLSTMLTAYASIVVIYALGYWFIGPDLGIGLDVFGISIALWVISEALYRWWSATFRWLSGLIGFAVAAVFGVTPAVMLQSPGDHWWIVLFWLPALLARHPAPGRRSYLPWYWLGVGSFLLAYAIWLTGVPDHPWCSPDSIIQSHAAWHLGTAFSTWCFFKFFRTEQRLSTNYLPVDPNPPSARSDDSRESTSTSS